MFRGPRRDARRRGTSSAERALAAAGLDKAGPFIVEAGELRERRCAECGKKTARWKPTRQCGTTVVHCDDCAAKAEPSAEREGACPSCGKTLRPGDRFCGKCGLRLEYGCPACGTAMEPEDLSCGKCGTRVT